MTRWTSRRRAGPDAGSSWGFRGLACVLVCVLVCVLAAGGCGRPKPAPTRVVKAGVEIEEACANRMQDILGQLLVYYSVTQQLPEVLEDLKNLDANIPPLVCPVSGKPYIYNKNGLRVPSWPGLLVLYDSEPTHAGLRWGLFVQLGEPGQPLSGRPILLADSPIFKAPPAPPAPARR
jgi:hypothetical protein